MDGNGFHERLDAYYAAGDAAGAYAFLRAQHDAALEGGDTMLLLTADNALIGHCRENVLFEEVEGYYREALDCIDRLGLHGTHAEATTFLNTATAFCIMGRMAESEALYDAAEALYRRILPPNDPYMAAVYNNRGLLLRAQGNAAAAYASFQKALSALETCADTEAETAATRLNLASVSPDAATGEAHLAAAEPYFASQDGQHDIHRFTARSTAAELKFRRGDFAAAGDGFAETAAAWETAGGAPQRRTVLLRNALLSYEKAGDAGKAAQIRAQLEEVP